MKRRLVTKLMMAAGVAAMAVTTIPASVFAAEDGGQTYGVTYWCESDFFKTVADSITEEAEADGNKTVVVDAQQDSAKQIQIIEDGMDVPKAGYQKLTREDVCLSLIHI